MIDSEHDAEEKLPTRSRCTFWYGTVKASSSDRFPSTICFLNRIPGIQLGTYLTNRELCSARHPRVRPRTYREKVDYRRTRATQSYGKRRCMLNLTDDAVMFILDLVAVCDHRCSPCHEPDNNQFLPFFIAEQLYLLIWSGNSSGDSQTPLWKMINSS